MNVEEFKKMRARQDIPHDDEICWDCHDRIPDRTTGSSRPSRLTCIMFLVIPLVVLILTYLFEIYRHY